MFNAQEQWFSNISVYQTRDSPDACVFLQAPQVTGVHMVQTRILKKPAWLFLGPLTNK